MKMLTPYDIAELMQMSYDTALDFIKTSGIAYIRIGRQYRVSENAFQTFVSSGHPENVKSSNRNIYNNSNHTASKILKLRRK